MSHDYRSDEEMAEDEQTRKQHAEVTKKLEQLRKLTGASFTVKELDVLLNPYKYNQLRVLEINEIHSRVYR